jgi:hypothetical protein
MYVRQGQWLQFREAKARVSNPASEDEWGLTCSISYVFFELLCRILSEDHQLRSGFVAVFECANDL